MLVTKMLENGSWEAKMGWFMCYSSAVGIQQPPEVINYDEELLQCLCAVRLEQKILNM